MKYVAIVFLLLMTGMALAEEPDYTYTCSAGDAECENAEMRKAAAKAIVAIQTGCSAYGSACAGQSGKTYKVWITELGNDQGHKCSDITYKYEVTGTPIIHPITLANGIEWIAPLKETEAVANNNEGCIPQTQATEHAAVWYNAQCHGSPAMVFSSVNLALTSGAHTYKVFLSVNGEYELPIGGLCWAIAAIGGE